MSGQPPPRTDAEWAREVDRKLRALERPSSTTVGPWTLSTGPVGELVAQHQTTGRRVVIAYPESPDVA